ncbi:MAG: hypothetical protein ACK4MQ_10155 [Hyphomonas sp.]
MATSIVSLLGITLCSYVCFRMYFLWCSFEPVVPDAFPDRKLVQFESLLCTALYVLQGWLYGIGEHLTASVLFWTCTGKIVSSAIFPPTYSALYTEGFFKRLVTGLWGSKSRALTISLIVFVYLKLFGWASPEGLSAPATLIHGGLAAAALFLVFKGLATAARGREISKILEERGQSFQLPKLLFAGALGWLALYIMLSVSPVSSVPQNGQWDDIVLVTSVFVGALFRL